MLNPDDEFYKRVDPRIQPSNDQISGEITGGKVSACSWRNGQQMARAKEETIEYFLAEYRKILEKNLADCINKFEVSMKRENKTHNAKLKVMLTYAPIS